MSLAERLRRPRVAATLAVAAALVVAVVWALRLKPATETNALEATRAARVVRRDAFGLTVAERVVRDRARVRAIVSALGVDALAAATCPADYSGAEIGVSLSGDDVYARRNVYVWGLFGDAGAPTVLLVRTSGCARGAPADAGALRRELEAVGIAGSAE